MGGDWPSWGGACAGRGRVRDGWGLVEQARGLGGKGGAARAKSRVESRHFLTCGFPRWPSGWANARSGGGHMEGDDSLPPLGH